jgi:excisionase family DNA binding protein
MKENKTIELTNYLSITDAVKLTGIRDSKIKYYIYRGKLKAVKIGWQWFVRKSDLEEFLKNFEKNE